MKIVIAVAIGLIVIAALFAGELYSQVGRYQTYWNRRNEQAPQKNEILYVALGDSTAQGIGATKPQKGYVGLIASKLQEQTDRPVRTINLSKYGEKIAGVLDRQLPLMQKLPITNKTVVTIEIGANDIGSFDAGRFESEMDQLMSKLPPQTIISDIPYFGGGLNRKLEPTVVEANKIMAKQAEKHGFVLADLHTHIQKDNTLRDYAVDYFHPSNHNYRTAWLPAFFEKIKVDQL